MTVTAPPRRSAPEESDALEALDALIEEARRRARRRRLRYAAIAVGVGVIALAVLIAIRGGRPGPAREASPSSAPAPTWRPSTHANGELTIIDQQRVSSLGLDRRVLFDCQSTPGCIDLESIAWSPDGRRLAFSVTGVGNWSAYLGVHVYDPATHRDRQISVENGLSLSWSPDGSRIAYVVPWAGSSTLPWGTIYVMNADGSHRRALQTGTPSIDMSPSWSADGTRIAFASANFDLDSSRLRDSNISIVDLDGSQRTRLARHASMPTWSPDGKTIAYRARCGGIKLMTPAGLDVTPASTELGCGVDAVRGVPVWSPDGRKLAVANALGVWVIDLRSPARGAELMTAFGARETGLGMFRTARPSWRAAR